MNVDLDSPCVLWTGRVNEQGYGRLTLPDSGGRQVYAHRHAYEAGLGPIPPGMTIDHLCCTPRCINVSHFELVSLAENARRAAERNRPSHCPAGHPYDELNTRVYVRPDGSPGRKCRACHRQWERTRKAKRRAVSA